MKNRLAKTSLFSKSIIYNKEIKNISIQRSLDDKRLIRYKKKFKIFLKRKIIEQPNN